MKNIAVKKPSGHLGGKILSYGGLIFFGLIMIIPLVMLVNVSFLTAEEFYENPLGFAFIGKSIKVLFANYADAFATLKVVERFAKTFLLTFISAVIGVVMALMAAFPISRGHFKGASKVFLFLLASMFFPTSLVGLIIVIQGMGLYNTPFALIILWSVGGLATHIFMLVGFIKSVPRELDEAAFIDGCPYFKYMFIIALPLLKPILSTLFVLRMIGAWNDFLNPYLFLTTDTWRTLSTGLFYYKGNYSSEWYNICAATVMVALPMVIIYCIFQRFIIEGMTAGALKG